jgi:deoxyxylulose-5-phosphate synthase
MSTKLLNFIPDCLNFSRYFFQIFNKAQAFFKQLFFLYRHTIQAPNDNDAIARLVKLPFRCVIVFVPVCTNKGKGFSISQQFWVKIV